MVITVTLAYFLYSVDSCSSSLSPEQPMARIGRFVVPDLPHHVTQRGNRRERVFFRTRTTRSTAICSARPAGARRSRCGAIADAQPRPSHPGARDARGAWPGARQGAPALFGLRQRAQPGDRPSLSVALFLGRHG